MVIGMVLGAVASGAPEKVECPWHGVVGAAELSGPELRIDGDVVTVRGSGTGPLVAEFEACGWERSAALLVTGTKSAIGLLPATVMEESKASAVRFAVEDAAVAAQAEHDRQERQRMEALEKARLEATTGEPATEILRGECVPRFGYLMGLSYSTGLATALQEQRAAANELREVRPTPEGGYFYADWSAIEIEGALGDRYVLVVRDSAGTELMRAEPDLADRVPSVPGADGWWTNGFVVPVPASPPFPLQVYLVNKAAGGRCGWDVFPHRPPTLRAEP